jgi:hypothetical protein
VILLQPVVVLDLCGYDAINIHLDAECLALFDFPEKKDSRFNGRSLSTKRAGRQLVLDPISKMEQCDDPTPELIAELADPNSITSSITKRGISPLVNPFLDVRSLLLQDEAVELETPKQHHVTIASEEKVLAMRSTQEEKCSKTGLMETVSLQSNATDLGTEDHP